MTNFNFSHENIRAVTTTDENGESVTFVAVNDITAVLIPRVTDAVVDTVITLTAGDPNEAAAAAEEMFVLDGMANILNLIDNLGRHMTDVSERLQAGLPAHEYDEIDPDEVEAQVQAFSDALSEATPQDFDR